MTAQQSLYAVAALVVIVAGGIYIADQAAPKPTQFERDLKALEESTERTKMLIECYENPGASDLHCPDYY